MDFCSGGVKSVPCEERESVHEGCDNGEDSSHRKNVVEVGYYVICVVKDNV